MDEIEIAVRSISDNPRFVVPSKATSGSHGYDLCASVTKPLALDPGKIVLVPTDVRLGLPANIEAQVRSRSGLAAKNGVFVLNSPGTIDSDYTGEVKVILANFGNDRFYVQPGMRVAQLVFNLVPNVKLVNTSTGNLFDNERGDGGFGSTGL
jgi:dUTP pyrophosphatase